MSVWRFPAAWDHVGAMATGRSLFRLVFQCQRAKRRCIKHRSRSNITPVRFGDGSQELPVEDTCGAGQDTYDPSMECVSCASCTTNGLAPAVRVLHEKPLGLVGQIPNQSSQNMNNRILGPITQNTSMTFNREPRLHDFCQGV